MNIIEAINEVQNEVQNEAINEVQNEANTSTTLEICPMFADDTLHTFYADQLPQLQCLKLARLLTKINLPTLQTLSLQECNISNLVAPKVIDLAIINCTYDTAILEQFTEAESITLESTEDQETLVLIKCPLSKLSLSGITVSNMTSFAGLTKLSCKNNEVTNSDLRMLTNLVDLELVHCNVSDISMLKGLQCVRISNCPIGSYGLNGLKLRSCKISWTNVSTILFTAIELTIENSPVECLPEANYEYLSLCDTKITDLSGIVVDKLTLINMHADILKTVKPVVIELSMISCFGSYKISAFKALKKLRWETCYPEMPGIISNDIAGLPLEELYLGNSEIDSIKTLKSLKKLVVRGPKSKMDPKVIKGLEIEGSFIDLQ